MYRYIIACVHNEKNPPEKIMHGAVKFIGALIVILFIIIIHHPPIFTHHSPLIALPSSLSLIALPSSFTPHHSSFITCFKKVHSLLIFVKKMYQYWNILHFQQKVCIFS